MPGRYLIIRTIRLQELIHRDGEMIMARERERQTDRQTDRKTDRDRETETEREGRGREREHELESFILVEPNN